MENTIKLTAQQLFYLATLMDAKHLDYSYISAMGLVEDSFKVFEARMLGELADSEVVSEDFNGDIEIRKDVKKLLEPVFYGKKEFTIDVYTSGEAASVDIYKYHISGDRITRVHCFDGSYEIDATDDSLINVALDNLFSQVTNSESEIIKQINTDEITHLISVKASVIGDRSRVDVLIKTGTGIFVERDDGSFERVNRKAYSADLLAYLKAVV